jgi:hypothetical protein
MVGIIIPNVHSFLTDGDKGPDIVRGDGNID